MYGRSRCRSSVARRSTGGTSSLARAKGTTAPAIASKTAAFFTTRVLCTRVGYHDNRRVVWRTQSRERSRRTKTKSVIEDLQELMIRWMSSCPTLSPKPSGRGRLDAASPPPKKEVGPQHFGNREKPIGRGGRRPESCAGAARRKSPLAWLRTMGRDLCLCTRKRAAGVRLSPPPAGHQPLTIARSVVLPTGFQLATQQRDLSGKLRH